MIQLIPYVKALDVMPSEEDLLRFVAEGPRVFDFNSFKLGFAIASFNADPSQKVVLGPSELHAFVQEFGHFDPASMNFGAEYEHATRQQPEQKPETNQEQKPEQ